MGYIAELRQSVGTRPIIMVGVAVAVYDDRGRILLQKRTDSLDWGVIGGALEPGESLEEAAGRELFEEAGLTARRFSFVTVLSGADMYYRYPHGDEVYNVTAVYKAEGVEGIPTIRDDEGLALRYFDLNEPIDGLNPMTEVILKKAGLMKAD